MDLLILRICQGQQGTTHFKHVYSIGLSHLCRLTVIGANYHLIGINNLPDVCRKFHSMGQLDGFLRLVLWQIDF